ncbi:PEP-CTERM sorting domain-containing protein [Pseudoduganella buxea]|nr:PEP-CTERM sorting domain-containing protein [Pseudoduganella buxea]GGC02008.1 hypothetical protein GCM10011572_24900 [Pseudoduganella buxea]
MKTIASLIAKSIAVAAASLTLAGAAHAGVVVSSVASQGVLTKKNANFDITNTEARSVPVWNVADDSSLLAFCIEPTVGMHTDNLNYTGSLFTGFGTSVKRLYSLYYSSFATSSGVLTGDNAVKALGFQLALWELNNDNGNLTSGNLAMAPLGNSTAAKAVIAEAKTMLLAATNESTAIVNDYKFTSYAAAGSQTVVTAMAVSPVPEPSSFAMMGLGLAAMGVIARRRRAA